MSVEGKGVTLSHSMSAVWHSCRIDASGSTTRLVM